MGIADRFSAMSAARQALFGGTRDPFRVVIERTMSATTGLIEGQPTLLFGTNNYLGLSHDAECLDASAEALRAFGTGTTGSRIANGTYSLHGELEAELARFYRRRSCMVFTTGYQANLGMLSALVGKGDYLVIDADSHASIYDGCRLSHAEVIRFRHNDPADLDRRLRRLEGTPGNKLVVVEGIYSMLGDTAPLAEIAAVKRAHGALLMVDEAHSLGVLGAFGRGLAESTGADRDVDFINGTFSKSLGSVGGFCVSDHPDFDVLRVVCRPYMFSASLPPAVIASARVALGRIERAPELRDRLWSNARRLWDGLHRRGFSIGAEASPIVPVRMPDIPTAAGFWNALMDAGLYVNLVLPPATPDEHPLLRASVMATHERAEIDRALACFEQAAAVVGLKLSEISGGREPAFAD